MLKTKKYKKILIVKPSSMGDVIHSFPVLNALKDFSPSSEIHWVIARGLEGLIEGHPMVNKIWIIDKDKWKKINSITKTLDEILTLSKSLREQKYDMVIDLQGLLRSGLITGLSNSPIRIGFKKGREFSPIFYNIRVKTQENIHAIQRYMKVLEVLGCSYDKIEFPMPLIKPSKSVQDIIARYSPYYVVVPGARWKTKQWFPERFSEVISTLDGYSIIVGSTSDRVIGESISHQSKEKAVNIAGDTTIQELICLIRHAKGVISNDTGPMHIAAALNKPLVAVFGPTSPLRTGPYSRNCQVVNADVGCAPCYKKTCAKMTCMKSIDAKNVLDAIEKLSYSNKGTLDISFQKITE